MEPSDSRLNSYYHHQHLQQQHHHHQQQQQQQQYNHNHNPTTTTVAPTTVTTAQSPTNGLLPPTTEGPPFTYPQSVPPSAVTSPPAESVRRKRGRPRKYETPEQALAARKTASSSGASVSGSKKKDKELQSLSACSSKKSQISAFGNVGQGLTPHIITVAAGEDVAQKIMMFTQQSMREICILSASGLISNASLRQPATSGGITYEGRFEIISLSGSYVRTELGGRTGGLSICLSSTDGQIVGGGVGGPLQAAGPVQVIIGTFVMNNKKSLNAGGASEPYAPQLPSPAGEVSVGFRSGHDDSPRQTDWPLMPNARSGGSYDFKGRTSHGGQQSPENGDY